MLATPAASLPAFGHIRTETTKQHLTHRLLLFLDQEVGLLVGSGAAIRRRVRRLTRESRALMVERSAEFRAVVKLFGGEGVVEAEVR